MPRKVVQLASGGAAPFVIADDSLGREAGSRLIVRMSPSFDAMVQTEPLFRSPGVENMERDEDTYNESVTYDLEVAYGFDTEDELAAFQRLVQSQVRPVGTVQISARGTTWYIVNAKCRPITTVREDAILWIARYSISGGQIAKTLSATNPGGSR